jgi:hypothetical protein
MSFRELEYWREKHQHIYALEKDAKLWLIAGGGELLINKTDGKSILLLLLHLTGRQILRLAVRSKLC